MIIYVAGCSKTEGSGLCDKDIFGEDYPGEISKDKLSSAWTSKRNSIIAKDPFLFEKVRQENIKRAWPAQLEKLSGHTVINGAVGGASIESLAMTLIHDIENLTNKPDLVFVGLSSIERIPLLNKYPITNYTALAFKNAMPNLISGIDKSYKSYCEEYWTSHTDEEMLTFYLYNCVMIQNYVLAKTGKKPIFLRTLETNGWKNIVDNTKIFLLKEFWKLLDFDTFLQSKGLEEFNDPPNIVLPDGHYKENTHVRFAEYIHKEYLNV